MNPETQYDRPTNLQDGWSVGDPAQFGLDPILLQDMKRRVADGQLDNVHAIIVARNGVLLYEQYAAGLDQKGIEPAAHAVFDATTRHNGNSMTKSVISLLVGIAFRRGWIEGLDTPVLAHFPEYADLSTPAKNGIMLRHLLAMSDGLGWSEFIPPFDSMKKMLAAPDAYRYILEREIAAPPGRTFNYNSGATELLGALLRKLSGKSLELLAKEKLFDPLGIEDVEWNARLPNGNPMACGALRARPRDWAKIGQLVLNCGAWNGKQIVPAEWVAESTSIQNNGPGQFLYGYHWWLGRSFAGGKVFDWVGAMGWGGQRLMIIPSLNMVVLVNAWIPGRMNLPEAVLLNEYILPAVVPAAS
jgi:CubicO group peptidase (beta-lactamase class C family)